MVEYVKDLKDDGVAVRSEKPERSVKVSKALLLHRILR